MHTHTHIHPHTHAPPTHTHIHTPTPTYIHPHPHTYTHTTTTHLTPPTPSRHRLLWIVSSCPRMQVCSCNYNVCFCYRLLQWLLVLIYIFCSSNRVRPVETKFLLHGHRLRLRFGQGNENGVCKHGSTVLGDMFRKQAFYFLEMY